MASLPDPAQGLAGLAAADFAKPAQPLNLGRLKNGKRLLPAAAMAGLSNRCAYL
jgi:hypothetical protein